MPEKDSFVQEVGKYFMNFLETDFHKTRLPKRNSMSKISKGFKVGIDLDKYSKLKKDFYGIFHDGFKKDTLSIKKGEYTSNISESIFKLISSKIKTLDDSLLEKTILEVEINLKEIRKVHAKNYQLYLEESLDNIQTIFWRHFILPFLNTIEAPLQTLELVDQNWLYQIEGELSDCLFSVFENMLASVLQQYFEDEYEPVQQKLLEAESGKVKKSFNIKKVLKNNISLEELQSNLELFFKNIAVSDAFDDLYILFKNNKTLDKTELYLYMYEISAGKHTFPLLYIPIKLEEKKSWFELIFDNKLFVNTKAIDYVVQEYNMESDSSGTLAWNYERIIYINDEENFVEKVKWIADSIQNFFKFSKSIDIESPEYKKVEHITSWFSNKSYIYLFDKSDESVINDYEEILQGEEGILWEFTTLLSDFIESNPKNFEKEVGDEWHEKDVSEKLIFESPIPLNDEQKQVVSALSKKDCKVVTLEGPPGTWKSHTITAIICRALLNGQSVLVLSDKKEALDVVEDKITGTLNTVRKDDDFLNPILRLWKSGNKFGKIVQGQTISKIAEHYSAYKHKKDDLDAEKQILLWNIEENIHTNIEHYENIALSDLQAYYENKSQFKDIHWLSDPSELEVDFIKLKDACEKIQSQEITSDIPSEIFAQWVWEQYSSIHESLKTLWEKNTLFKENNPHIDISDVGDFEPNAQVHEEYIAALRELSLCIDTLKENFHNTALSSYFWVIDFKEKDSYDALWVSLDEFMQLRDKALKFNGSSLKDLWVLTHFELEKFQGSETISSLRKISDEIIALKKPLVGYALSKKKLEEKYRDIKSFFPYLDTEKLVKTYWVIPKVIDLLGFMYEQENKEDESFVKTWNIFIQSASNSKVIDSVIQINQDIISLYQEKGFLESDLIIQDEIARREWYIDIAPDVEVSLEGLEEIKKHISGYDMSEEFLVQYTWDSKYEDEYKGAQKLHEYYSEIQYIQMLTSEYPTLCENIQLHFNPENINSVSSILSNYDEAFIRSYLEHSSLEWKIHAQFVNIPDDIFADGISEVQEQTTAEMAYFLDKRIVEYTRNYSKEVSTLKGIISKKKKFPKWLFKNLKNAFPCILAGIRDYSEYIPLEKDLFDLIIIDEASQVSIAQSLPALIRWKKIIILWDDKQFSNVKSNNASKLVNQEYKTKVRKTFIEQNLQGKEDEYGWLENVWNFDIKYSILKFSQSIQNYKCQLRKHFRCYPEIISYSDKYFYAGSLQCMKIRWKAIEEVIKFDIIPHDGLIDVSKNTNMLEVDFIIEKLQEFHDSWIVQSIGIISPHQHQVSLLQDKIWDLDIKSWLFDTCKLKIMTFDSCQGEERDYIFYSMVASEQKDRLKYVFIKNLWDQDFEEDGSVKAQRLNVWFSRAKECVHFVLSKPIEKFDGEIKNALLHFNQELEAGKKVVLGGTDINSPMEKKIQEYFFATDFYKSNSDDLELIPQFDLGKYLRQLDTSYNHPAYKVDFLLIYKNKKLVIEYDGFKEHFEDLSNVTSENHKSYMKADDIYRQKVLEGYGYKFLRINKFTIWNDPVKTLSDRLDVVFKKKRVQTKTLDSLHDQIDKLKDGDERACETCWKIFNSVYFPYKTKNQCLPCYEKENGRTLHSKRTDIQRFEFRKRLKEHEDNTKKPVITEPVKKEVIDDFQRENTIEEIKKYLEVSKKNGSSISFYYKEKQEMSTFTNYYHDDTYVHVKHWNSRYYIKYLINKIRKIV